MPPAGWLLAPSLHLRLCWVCKHPTSCAYPTPNPDPDPLVPSPSCACQARAACSIQGVTLDLEEGTAAVADDALRERLRETISNAKLSERFLALARDLDVMEPRAPDDVRLRSFSPCFSPEPHH